jgi:hypothetical protein
VELPPGLACEFGVGYTQGPDTRKAHTFTDKAGNVVVITAGKGTDLTFTNLETQKTVSFKGNGTVSKVTTAPDGTVTYVTTGHNVLILFPTDVPAGPSTTLTVGRVVFTIDLDGVFTVRSVSGKTTDVCELLSE